MSKTDSNKEINVIVNGRQKKFARSNITFNEAIALTFGNINTANMLICFTITYAKGPKKNEFGSMVQGDNIHVQEGMVFNITATDKS